nr:uncharacterized protein LOC105857916 [Microcebus murinus]
MPISPRALWISLHKHMQKPLRWAWLRGPEGDSTALGQGCRQRVANFHTAVVGRELGSPAFLLTWEKTFLFNFLQIHLGWCINSCHYDATGINPVSCQEARLWGCSGLSPGRHAVSRAHPRPVRASHTPTEQALFLTCGTHTRTVPARPLLEAPHGVAHQRSVAPRHASGRRCACRRRLPCTRGALLCGSGPLARTLWAPCCTLTRAKELGCTSEAVPPTSHRDFFHVTQGECPALHRPTWRAQGTGKFETIPTDGATKLPCSGGLSRDHHTAFAAPTQGAVPSPFSLPCISGSLPSPPHLLLSAHLGALLPPPLPPPPARFLLPHPAVRSESCAYDTSVCCHGNRGGLRLERGAQGSGPSAT